MLIRDWHVKNQWRTIGYHEVIQNGHPTSAWSAAKVVVPHLEGAVEIGRPIDCDKDFETWEMGAHVKGWNTGSYGICMIGDKHFSDKVLNATLEVVKYRMGQLDVTAENVLGHYEKDSGKSCPNIDMEEFRDKLKSGALYGQDNLPPPVRTAVPSETRRVVNIPLTFSKLFSYLRRTRRRGG